MSRQFAQVVSFNRNLLNIEPREVGEMVPNEMKLSLVQLREEIDELEEAYDNHDFIKQVDALIDLQYFAFGVFYKIGISPDQYEKIFDAVHEANMNKKLGVNGKRGDHGVADATKPDGWKDPQETIAEILGEQR